MTPKRWIALFLFYITYLLFGASIYYHIENRLEREKRADELQKRIEINEFLVHHLSSKDDETQNDILQRISDYCDKPVTNYTLDKYEEPYRWTFYHAFFFAFTVCSTVGYGNLSPSTTLGQMIMIVYSLIGIPVNGILFAGLGDFFGRTFINIYRKYKKYKMDYDDKYVPHQLGLITTITIALVPGITFFIVLPSLIFSYFEGWPYSLSIYFSYVTTTTIGFGDYVPTFQSHQERDYGLSFVFYQLFIIIWFIFALGYVVMIMTFITKGLRSKKLQALEHQLSANIKATQHRIWHGVTKDVSYLRRILNELYMMKFKPIYHEPGDKYKSHLPRSASCPELSMYRMEVPIVGRKRAFSENFGSQEMDDLEQLAFGTPQQTTIVRGSSDTDLNRINVQKTFETAQALHHTTDLLARVVSALGHISSIPNDEIQLNNGGYHGFPDSDILASEMWPYNTIVPQCRRERASSDFHLPQKTFQSPLDNEWTWGGDNYQIQQVINNRVKTKTKQENLYKASLNRLQPFSRDITIDMDMETVDENNRIAQLSSLRKDSKAFLKKLLPFRGKFKDNAEKRRKSTDGLSERNTVDDNSKNIETNNYVSLTQDSKGTNILPYNIKSYRRGSAFPAVNSERKLSNNQGNPFVGNVISNNMFESNLNRRGSLFSVLDRYGKRTSELDIRRGSLFSIPSQNQINHGVLETTTLADLIRALEVVHTHATLSENLTDNPKPTKQRKLGTASLTPPKISPLFTLFSQPPHTEQSQTINYSRQNTGFDTITTNSNQSTLTSVMPPTTRRFSNRPSVDPPPYSEKPNTPKFKRRFSVRPTNLQIPPGKAPPPPKPQSILPSQTTLQRKLSLRPSPLARELQNDLEDVGGGSSTGSPKIIGKTVFNRMTAAQASIGPGRSSISTRTHSPLTRIAQWQASRKISLPEGKITLSSTSKSDTTSESDDKNISKNDNNDSNDLK